MATDALRSLWAEPRPTNAPDRGPRDWALVAVLVGWSVVEVVLRQDLAPRPLLLLAVLAVLGPLLWRRTHPLVAVAVSFGTLTIVDIVRILTGSQGGLLNSISAALILAYALFRWGSGREAASGLGVILLWLAITYVADTHEPVGDGRRVRGLPVRRRARRRDPLSREDPHPRHRPSQGPRTRTARS